MGAIMERPAALVLVAMATLQGAEVEAHVEASPLEVSLACPDQGLCIAELSVGTPSQTVVVSVDSGSSVLWVPNGTASSGTAPAGFLPRNSSSFKEGEHVTLQPYADGLVVSGTSAHETVAIGGTPTKASPLLVADPAGSEGGMWRLPAVLPGAHGGEGALSPGGLLKDMQHASGVSSDVRTGILGLGSCSAGEEWKAGDENEPVEGFFCHFWTGRPEGTPRTTRLDLGGQSPRLVLGAPIHEGSREHGEFRFAAQKFTSSTKNWFVGVRAFGIEAKEHPGFFSLHMPKHVDFNAQLPLGAAALLDSGAGAIRVGAAFFAMILAAMPSGCKRSGLGIASGSSIVCDCSSVEELPTLTFSIEAAENWRFLGLDAGKDFLVCVPPSAYAVRKDKSCNVGIVDGGERHKVFGVEALVLGAPFFRAASVAYDADRRQVAIGPHRDGAECDCIDPKSWWSTGMRLSSRRILLCLFAVAALAAYIYINYSPSSLAGTCRSQLGGFMSAAGNRLAEARANAELRLQDASSGVAGVGGGGAAREPRLQSSGASGVNGPMLDDSDPGMQLADQTGFVAMHSDAET